MCGLELEAVWSEGFNPRSQSISLRLSQNLSFFNSIK